MSGKANGKPEPLCPSCVDYPLLPEILFPYPREQHGPLRGPRPALHLRALTRPLKMPQHDHPSAPRCGYVSALTAESIRADNPAMGLNKRKMEDAEAEATSRVVGRKGEAAEAAHDGGGLRDGQGPPGSREGPKLTLAAAASIRIDVDQASVLAGSARSSTYRAANRRAPASSERPSSTARRATSRVTSSLTSRAHASTVLKAITRTGLLYWPVKRSLTTRRRRRMTGQGWRRMAWRELTTLQGQGARLLCGRDGSSQTSGYARPDHKGFAAVQMSW